MPIEFETTREIAAPAPLIWPILADVERWPEWTASITSVECLNPGPLGVAARYKVRQPKLFPAIWQVTKYQRDRGFIWESNSPGVRTVAEHWITPHETTPPNSTVVTKIKLTGAMVTLLRPWIAKITKRYVEMEADGLKRRCETSAQV